MDKTWYCITTALTLSSQELNDSLHYYVPNLCYIFRNIMKSTWAPSINCFSFDLIY
jgi:hypothetical protein